MKAIVFDGDGTLWHYPYNVFGSSWCALSYALGVLDDANKLLKYYYNKPNSDEIWARKQAKLFLGKETRIAEEKLYPVPYLKGTKEFIEMLSNKIVLKGLLTTGLDIVAEKAARELGLDFCFCNILPKKEGVFTGGVDYIVPLWKKHLVLGRFCLDNNFSLENIIYFGDTKNDIECMEMSRVSIAVNPKDKEVKDKANFIVPDFVQAIDKIEKFLR